jgi:hypothetical protein
MAHVLTTASPLRDSAFQSRWMEVTVPASGLMLASDETNWPDHNHWNWRWPNTTGHKLALPSSNI